MRFVKSKEEGEEQEEHLCGSGFQLIRGKMLEDFLVVEVLHNQPLSKLCDGAFESSRKAAVVLHNRMDNYRERRKYVIFADE